MKQQLRTLLVKEQHGLERVDEETKQLIPVTFFQSLLKQKIDPILTHE